ncbi:Ltp family lipoprotein [Bifidobacterium aemilianum]|nr:Ltp family lipoprotein [Bifidobacterium aemilianum]
MVLAIIAIYSATMNGDKTKTDTSATSATSSSQTQEQKPEEPKKESAPAEYTSALNKAKTYSDMMHMSKQGIYEQLTSEAGEKFKPEAAQYAVDNLKADYNANALAKAKDYQKTMSMSPDAIRDQLTSDADEKFTPEEAQYAVDNLNK